MKKVNPIVVFHAKFVQTELMELFQSNPGTKRIVFVGCTFKGLEFHKSLQIRGDFKNCSFEESSFLECTIRGGFNRCDFSGAKFIQATFEVPIFQSCQFNRAKFTGNLGLYSATFDTKCSMSSARGILVSENYKSGNHSCLFVSQVQGIQADCVPEEVEIEKTDKFVTGYYEQYLIEQHEQDRRKLMSQLKEKIKERSLGNTNFTLDSKAVLICSREDFIVW